MYLNLNNGYRDGQGFQGLDGTPEPVYYRFISGRYITFWFHYGYSQTVNVGHEGDWERISIKLSASNTPTAIEYFHHFSSCTLLWRDVPRSSVDGRPVVWVTKEAHGSYPAGYEPMFSDKINGNGPLWRTWQNLAGVRAQPWFGYAGGWGSPGANGVLSGPSAPPTHPAPQFKSGKCDEN